MNAGIGNHVDTLWAAAMAGDQYAAIDAATAAIDAGVPVETLLMDVVAAVQARVGHEWAANRITVAQEHTATAVNERVLDALAHHPAMRQSRAPGRGRVAVACIDGEWHAFPARLLSEVLRVNGWHVDYLGAQIATRHLVAHLHRTNPDAAAQVVASAVDVLAGLLTGFPRALATLARARDVLRPAVTSAR
ncbi:cobalamin B12-binding domain-containing protein [Nonomuraea sp. KM88]|uniref:cobalamin B12-binding domain-containing protein n=1 Tax=Nonomuraea sp. KM88 TaxID=3457427 RepID=UPI003FCE6E20